MDLDTAENHRCYILKKLLTHPNILLKLYGIKALFKLLVIQQSVLKVALSYFDGPRVN